MSSPIALGAPSLPSLNTKDKMDWGANALSAPTTPSKRQVPVDRSKADPMAVKAAEGMEAMFLDYMLKVMRDTVPQNEMDLENGATKIYRSMVDSEYAQKAVRAGGIGLADQIIAYLESQRYTLPRGQVAPSPAQGSAQGAEKQGGSDEGQPFRK